MFSAEDEAILLRCSTMVKVEDRGLQHPVASVCFYYKFYLLSEPKYKLSNGNNSSIKICFWGNYLT